MGYPELISPYWVGRAKDIHRGQNYDNVGKWWSSQKPVQAVLNVSLKLFTLQYNYDSQNLNLTSNIHLNLFSFIANMQYLSHLCADIHVESFALKGMSSEIELVESSINQWSLLKRDTPRFSTTFAHPLSCERPFKCWHDLKQYLGYDN